jgi:hypothetical protein
VEDRDRQSLHFLGGRERVPVSLTVESRVQTRPVLAAIGIGRAWRTPAVRFAVAGSLVVAPIRVVDEMGVYLEQETISEIEATGTGFGGELTASLDYFTDTDMNLYVELFGRAGHTDVELVDAIWESTAFPGTRRVDLEGAGVRVGFRWI